MKEGTENLISCLENIIRELSAEDLRLLYITALELKKQK